MAGASSSLFNDVWSSADGAVWVEMTNSAGWSAREQSNSIVHNNNIYIMGGYAGAYVNDVWSSPNGSTWDLVTNNA